MSTKDSSTEQKTSSSGEQLEGGKNDFSGFAKEEDKKAFNLQNFIARHYRRPVKYTTGELHAFLDKVIETFRGKSALVEVSAPVNICGDIHGQFSDLLRIFNTCGKPGKSKYLFLGDYIDRGKHSLEVINLLFALKIARPKHIFLLRGNHELRAINKNYGFHSELQSRLRSENATGPINDLYDHYNYVFTYMPLSGLISKRILCMHGGISPHLKSFDDIRNIALPLETAKQHPLACDLLWADPEKGCKGFEPNKIRAIAHIFGEGEVEAMCTRLNIDMIVRAHQVVEYGYAFFAHRKLITVFSASRYQDELDNYSGVVGVTAELEVHFYQLKPEEFEKRRDEVDRNGADNNEQPTAKGT